MPSRFTGRFTLLVAAATLCGALPIRGQQLQSPREQLKQYVADLQKNPSDDDLRGKIIKLALTLDPKPATPPEVQELLGRGGQAFEDAKKAISAGDTVAANTDLALAAAAFSKASLAAPWVADYYLNLASANDAAKNYPQSLKNYEFYLEAAPDAQDADKVRQRIGALKYELDKQQAADDAAHAATAQAERQRENQVRAQEERGRLYPFEGTWQGEDNNTTNPLGLLQFFPIQIWYDTGWKAAYRNKDGSSSSDSDPVDVEHTSGSHITLLIHNISFNETDRVELDISSDGQSLTGRAEVRNGSMAHPGKWIWVPAVLHKVGR